MPMSTTICKNDTFSCFFSTIHTYFGLKAIRAKIYCIIYL